MNQKDLAGQIWDITNLPKKLSVKKLSSISLLTLALHHPLVPDDKWPTATQKTG